MKTTLCTLYNNLYLDKGLVLYDSLKDCANDFELYVLCMDDRCFEVLTDMGEDRLIPIHLADVENEKMLAAKSNRSIAEYCWTCSSRLIQYILETFKVECCTYIDADMYFYHDPQILVGEMLSAGKSVMMVPHRFTERNQSLSTKVGTYCVEFNCFKNDAAGKKVLNYWHNQCLECCSNIGDGIHWGDQKYMDDWPILFPGKVHVCEHPGAGIAPWNIEWYQDVDDKTASVVYRKSRERTDVIFYHFQSIRYIRKKEIDTSLMANNQYVDYALVDSLYKPYLQRIDKKKDFISQKYGIDFLVKSHPSLKKQNWLKRFVKSIGVAKAVIEKLKNNTPYIIHIDE